jgi:hypothetical protein
MSPLRALSYISSSARARLLLTLASGLVACTTVTAQREPLVVSGVILNLTQRTFTELETIQVRTDGGEVMTFAFEGDAGLTPGHAREHMSFVQPITVHYRETERGHVALLITD